MSKSRFKTGYKTHDVTAEWHDEQGTHHRELVGMRSVTDTGDSIEIFFKKFPLESATIIATPIRKE